MAFVSKCLIFCLLSLSLPVWSGPFLFAVSWNIHSLVEDSGDARVCRSTTTVPCHDIRTVDRKIDFLAAELTRCRIAVAGDQETKWFGSDVWSVGKNTFLHSCRPLPADGEPRRRNEVVGIFLDANMSVALKRGGEKWSAVSSRIITARLLIGAAGSRLSCGRRRRSDFYLFIVSVYAPTSKAPPAVRQQFVDHLQEVITGIPPNEVLLVFLGFQRSSGLSSPHPRGYSRMAFIVIAAPGGQLLGLLVWALAIALVKICSCFVLCTSYPS